MLWKTILTWYETYASSYKSFFKYRRIRKALLKRWIAENDLNLLRI